MAEAGYIIEARSIGGLSGSPVFLNLGTVRVIKNELKFSPEGQSICLLLGLIHGHYDNKSNEIDEVEEDATDKINTGTAIVVPFEKIFEVINEFEKTIK